MSLDLQRKIEAYDSFLRSKIGTVLARAVKAGRRGLGVELAGGYFRDAIYYCEAEEKKRVVPTLFAMEESGG